VKSVIRLLKVASKQASIDLRAKSPLTCPCIDTKVVVSKVYFNHIAFSKSRELKDLAKRLGMIPLIPEILANGKLLKEETREEDERTYFRIGLKKANLHLIAIVVKRKDDYALLSSFVA
jgi:hypothetical protein